jgi:hypothetical protein
MDDDLHKRVSDECDAQLRARERARQSAPTGIPDPEGWLAARRLAKLPRPAPPQPSAITLSPEVQKRWDEWADNRIQKFMNGFMEEYTEALFNKIGKEVSEMVDDERAKMREHVAKELQKVREEISGLRIDEVVGRSVLRGEINELRETTRAKKKVRL